MLAALRSFHEFDDSPEGHFSDRDIDRRTNAATAERLPADRAVLSGWTVKAVGRERDGVLTKGEEVRETRGKLVGWACAPTTAACAGKRNDLESDNAPVPITKTQVVSLAGGKQHRSSRR